MKLDNDYFEKAVPKKWGRFRLKGKVKKFYKAKFKYIKRYSKKLDEQATKELTESFLLLKNSYKKEKDKVKIREQFISTQKILYKHLPEMLERSFMEFVEVLISAIIIVFFLRAFLVDTYHIPTGSMIPTILPGDRIFASKFIYGFSIPWTNYKFLEWKSPEDGDIIIFEPPSKKYKEFTYTPGTLDNFVKRMLAKEGDSVEIKKNIVYINGKPIERKVINKKFFFDDLDQRESQGRSSVGVVYQEKHGDNTYISVTTNQVLDYFGVDKSGKLSTNPAKIKSAYKVPDDSLFLLSDNRDIYSLDSRLTDSRVFGAVKIEDIKDENKNIGDVVKDYKHPSNLPVPLRVMAKAGETVEIKNKVVYINDKPLKFVEQEYPMLKDDSQYFKMTYSAKYKESYNDKEYSIYWSISDTANFGIDKFGKVSFYTIDIPNKNINKIVKPYIVPKGYAFAIGDNRDGSFDSRFWGPVPLKNIKGAPLIIWFSSNNWFPRFNRFFKIFYRR